MYSYVQIFQQLLSFVHNKNLNRFPSSPQVAVVHKCDSKLKYANILTKRLTKEIEKLLR